MGRDFLGATIMKYLSTSNALYYLRTSKICHERQSEALQCYVFEMNADSPGNENSPAFQLEHEIM